MQRTARLAAGLLIGALACRAAGGDIVTFPDPNLEAAVRAELGIPAPTPMTEADMLGLTELNAYIAGIESLGGLEYASNLHLLDVAYNKIQSVQPISALVAIVYLNLYDNQVASASPLSGLTEMFYLELGRNNLTDIGALAGMSKLNTLVLSDNHIEDINVLAGLSRLEFLFISDNDIEDISCLAGLSELAVLMMQNNGISDISALSGLTQLHFVDLRGNPLDADAYNVTIPCILDNNPGITLLYDPIPEPSTLAVLCAGIVLAIRRRAG